jgi:heme A synthase
MLAYVGQRLGLELLDEHSPLKHWMHRLDAVIGAVVVVAAAYFIWSRIKVYKQYKAEGAAAVAKAD